MKLQKLVIGMALVVLACRGAWAAVGQFDQTLPNARETAAMTQRAVKVGANARAWSVEQVSSAFNMVRIVHHGCSAASGYRNKAVCYIRAISTLYNPHMDAIARSCTGLSSWYNEAQCFQSAFNQLHPRVFFHYQRAKGTILHMCTGHDNWYDEAACFDAASAAAGGHFLRIRSVCGSINGYRDRTVCYIRSLE